MALLPTRDIGSRSRPAAEDPRTAAILGGDIQAFEMFFRETAPGLLAFLIRVTGSRSDAEEVVQDVFSILWSRRTTLEIRESLTTYVYAAGRNLALNKVVRERRRATLASASIRSFGSDVAPDVDDGLAEREIMQALTKAIDALPPRCRDVFTLSRFRGQTYPQIAETLGISVKAVEKQIGRALKHIRSSLDRYV